MKNKVQIYREQKNLTQTELAEQSGLSLRTIQRIEAGSIPKGYTLKSLAQALETEPEMLAFNKTVAEEIYIDKNRAKMINISSLSFLLLPFGNIIIPSILTYKTKDERTRSLGKNIIQIQIIWTIITSILMIVSPFLQFIIPIKTPFFIIFLVVLFCINAFIILKNGASLDNKSELYIKLKNSIL